MPTKKNLITAALSLVVGLFAGAAYRLPVDRPVPPADEATLGSARAKDPSLPLAQELVELIPSNVWDSGGSPAAWSMVAGLELPELTGLVRHLDRRAWLSTAESKALQMAIQRWALLEPAAALDWIESGSHSKVSLSAYRYAFAAFAADDLEAALERLEKLPARFRYGALSGLARPFAEADPARAAQFYRDQGRRRSFWASQEIAEIWASSDPLAAINFYSQDQARSDLVAMVVGQWGADDRETALAWIKEQDLDPSKHKRYIEEIASRLISKDPFAAMALLEELPAGLNRNFAMTGLLDKWGKKDTAAAVAWARALEDPAAQARALKQISESIRSIDPELALELADALPSAEFRNQAFESYADARAEEDPEGALAWAEGLEDEDRRRSAITSSVAGLASQDLVKAIDYLTASEDQTHKKEMFAKMLRNDNVGPGQFDAAREIAAKLSKEDEKLAIETMLEVNGDEIPIAVRTLLKLTGDLDTFLDWAEKMNGLLGR